MFWIIVSLWLALVFMALMLGCLRYIPWKGVVIWEAVMFSPFVIIFGLIALVLMGSLRSKGISENTRNLYIPSINTRDFYLPRGKTR